jgi:hypothetical protein
MDREARACPAEDEWTGGYLDQLLNEAVACDELSPMRADEVRRLR